MADNVIDFTRQREIQALRRKEDKVEALRQAFRLARGDAESEKTGKNRKRRNKRSRNSRK